MGCSSRAGLTSGSCAQAGRLRKSIAEARERQIPARMTSGDVFFIETSMDRIYLFYQKAEENIWEVRKFRS
jgi:hypothetical protein